MVLSKEAEAINLLSVEIVTLFALLLCYPIIKYSFVSIFQHLTVLSLEPDLINLSSDVRQTE